MTPLPPQIDWSKEFEIGVEDIDIQHHFFINLVKRLADELQIPGVTPYRAALISELNAYARFHFISEENMMARTGYPELESHRMHHHQLIEQLSARENSLLLHNSREQANAIIEFLFDWFRHHTIQEDRLFADYLVDRKK
ncbi:MAG: hemerythrin family protein [Gammaproteobacteria bacterium]|nr:hemerythrin family protein [Gammaproteobacteria bacterium]